MTTWRGGSGICICRGGSGITAALEYLGSTYVDVRVSGGTAGTSYAVTVRATSAPKGRITDRTVRFDCKER